MGKCNFSFYPIPTKLFPCSFHSGGTKVALSTTTEIPNVQTDSSLVYSLYMTVSQSINQSFSHRQSWLV